MRGEYRLKAYFYNTCGAEFIVTRYNLTYCKLIQAVKAMYRQNAFKVETAKMGGRHE